MSRLGSALLGSNEYARPLICPPMEKTSGKPMRLERVCNNQRYGRSGTALAIFVHARTGSTLLGSILLARDLGFQVPRMACWLGMVRALPVPCPWHKRSSARRCAAGMAVV